MSKYIDSEKLIAEIERLSGQYGDTIFDNAAKAALEKVYSITTSLQQEQEKHIIGGQVFGATDVEQLYEGKVYIVSNLVQDTEFGLSVRDKVKIMLIKD